ncbi:MAG: hypothetical protein GF308_00505 [Candidatus Heimdallarchaeota archaeon]|nr:hypothetical protein [Candidatus Heimdallarchaeota archaeon]
MVAEKDLYPIIIDHFIQKGFKCYLEVKYYSRKIDIIATKGKIIFAIEAKIANWQKALQQALTCKICANKVYIAMWHNFIHRIPLNKVKQYGIGLLEIDGNVKEIIKPKKSKLFYKPVSEEVLQRAGRN